MTELLEDLGFFENLIYFVCMFKKICDVYGLNGDNFFSLFVLCSEDLAKATLSQQYVHFVLVYDLTCVEWSTLGVKVEGVAILNEIYVILTNAEASQIENANILGVIETHLIADGLEQTVELLHVVVGNLASLESGVLIVVQSNLQLVVKTKA